MPLYDDWKKEMQQRIEREERISSSQRCPRCKKPTLSYDEQSSRFRCSSCGFEEIIPVMQ